jgi:hypothetical protein
MAVTLSVTARCRIYFDEDRNRTAAECAKRAWLLVYGDIERELGKIAYDLQRIAIDNMSANEDPRLTTVRDAIQQLRIKCSQVQPAKCQTSSPTT